MELVLGIIGIVLLVSTGLVTGYYISCRNVSRWSEKENKEMNTNKEKLSARAENDLLYKFARSLDGIELTKNQARDIKDIVDTRTCNKN